MRILFSFISIWAICTSCSAQKEGDELRQEIKEQGFPDNEIAVTLELFFNGNNELGSIGPNLDHELAPDKFYALFKKIESDNRTNSIFVRIADMEDGLWPYSDAIYLIGIWTKEDLYNAIKISAPTEIMEGWLYGKPMNIKQIEGNVFTIWWD